MKLALQLYTVRDQTTTAEGFREVLQLTHELGYEGVQLSAVGCMNGESPEVSAEQARQWLDEFGLDCCSTHRPWERFEKHLEEEIEFHKTLRCSHCAIGVPPKFAPEGGAMGWIELADKMSAVAKKLGEAGIQFGYHNHALEFERLPPHGNRPFEILYGRCDPSVTFILDTYWVVHAGIELFPLIQMLRGRLPVVHLKDRACFGWEVDFAPIGEGNLSWEKILPAFEEAGTEWLVVEQDTCRRDVWSCIESSMSFLESRV